MNENHRIRGRRGSGPPRGTPLGDLVPPRPPEELRARTLVAARDALGEGSAGRRPPVRRPLTDRLWESRALRLAWAAVVVVCLVANFLIGRVRTTPPTGGEGAAPPSSVAATAAPGGAGIRPLQAPEDRRMTLLESRKILLRSWLAAGDEAPEPKEAPL